MIKRKICRGDIYHADLDPAFGSEQGGYRPVLIIQNNWGNKYSPTVIVAAITSREKNRLPTHVPLRKVDGLDRESVVLLEQIRTLDKLRLKNYIGTIPRAYTERVDKCLMNSLDLKKKLKGVDKHGRRKYSTAGDKRM